MDKDCNITNLILGLLKEENDLFNENKNYGNNKSLVNFDYYSFFFLEEGGLLSFFNGLTEAQKENAYKDLDLTEFKGVPLEELLGCSEQDNAIRREVNGSFVAVKRSSITSELLKSYVGKDFDDCKFNESFSNVNKSSDFFINPLLIKLFMDVAVVKDKEAFYCKGKRFSFFSNLQSFMIGLDKNHPLAKFENAELSLWDYSKNKINEEYMAFESGCLINNQDVTVDECKKINILDLIGLKHKGKDINFFKDVFASILNDGLLPNGEEIVLISDVGGVTLKSWVNSPSVEMRNKHLKGLLISKLRKEFPFKKKDFNKVKKSGFDLSYVIHNPIVDMTSGNDDLINRSSYKEDAEEYFDTSTMGELISILIDDEEFKNKAFSVLGIDGQDKNKGAVDDENTLVLSVDLLKIVGERSMCFDMIKAKEYVKKINSLVEIVKNVAESDIFERSLVVLKPELTSCFTDVALKADPLIISIFGDINKDDLNLFKEHLPAVCQYLWHHPDLNVESKQKSLISSISSYFNKEKSLLILNTADSVNCDQGKKIDFKL